jgi:SAM-dependent methyltransferase
MHPASMQHMRDVRKKYLGYLDKLGQPNICDDGGLHNSPDKCYKTVFACIPGILRYSVCDIVPHPSVSHVKPSPFTLPFPDQDFDLVVSGQMLEHCQNPFKAVAEQKRVLKVGSCLVIIVPSTGRWHDAQDGWRFMKDAFKFIAAEVGGLETLYDHIDKSSDAESRAGIWHDHIWVARRIA